MPTEAITAAIRSILGDYVSPEKIRELDAVLRSIYGPEVETEIAMLRGELECSEQEVEDLRQDAGIPDLEASIMVEREKTARLRALLARAGEALNDAIEGSDVARKLSANIREHGNYTSETMVTFLEQIPIGNFARTVAAEIEKEIGND